MVVSALFRSVQPMVTFPVPLPLRRAAYERDDFFLALTDGTLPMLGLALQPIEDSANLQVGCAKRLLSVYAELAQLFAQFLEGIERVDAGRGAHGGLLALVQVVFNPLGFAHQ